MTFLVAVVAPRLATSDNVEPDTICFYLDASKLNGSLKPIDFFANQSLSGTPSLQLADSGLTTGTQRVCQWSLNGGSGSREHFELDGGEAAPILVESCEHPFAHVYTGVGFGNWYLTLCAKRSQLGVLSVEFDSRPLFLAKDSLLQWTGYLPGAFPISGDSGC